MEIKSFRGQIAHGGQDLVPLRTNNGSIGYKIVKLEIMPNLTGAINAELVLKVYSIEQATVDATINFSDQTLLAVGYFKVHQDASTGSNEGSQNYAVVFDNVIFNQDIFITAEDTAGIEPTNYHLELERMKLDLNQNTVATLKDIRNETLTI